eukprot:1524946-Amphidinium_carterae.2
MRPTSSERVHAVGGDGRLVSNRRGRLLCSEFQTGACGPATQDCTCPRDPSRVHQCALCLAPSHGANSCTLTTPKPLNVKGKSKGKGKPQY